MTEEKETNEYVSHLKKPEYNSIVEKSQISYNEPPKLPEYSKSESPLLPNYQHTSPNPLPAYKPHEGFKPPHADYIPPPNLLPNHGPSKDGINPSLLPHHGPPSEKYLPPIDNLISTTYRPPIDDYIPPLPHPLPAHTTYLPPNSDYKPPHPSYKPPTKDYIPPHSKPSQTPAAYSPPNKEYLPPNPNYSIPDHHDLHHSPPSNNLQSYAPPHADYLPPHANYLPPHADYLPPHESHEEHKHISGYSPPNKEYLPPKLPGYNGEHHPAGLSDYNEGIPAPKLPNNYLPPTESYHAPKGLDSTYKTPTKEFIPPNHHDSKDQHHSNHHLSEYAPHNPSYDHIHPPNKEYLPPHKPTYDHIHPPNKEYLPPKKPSYDHIHPPNKEYLPPPEYIPAIEEEISSLEPPTLDYLPPPSRGPQFSSDLSYVAPPPRNKNADILNSHIVPPNEDLTDTYIPPKTKNDVPKNFLRPEDIPSIDDPELIDILDSELKATIEELELDGAFFGLAKLRDGTHDEESNDNQKSRYVILTLHLTSLP